MFVTANEAARIARCKPATITRNVEPAAQYATSDLEDWQPLYRLKDVRALREEIETYQENQPHFFTVTAAANLVSVDPATVKKHVPQASFYIRNGKRYPLYLKEDVLRILGPEIAV